MCRRGGGKLYQWHDDSLSPQFAGGASGTVQSSGDYSDGRTRRGRFCPSRQLPPFISGIMDAAGDAVEQGPGSPACQHD